MKFKYTKYFLANVKHLKKKYKKIDQDLKSLKKYILENPAEGKPLGHGLYKIRYKNSDKNIGKSGGYRIIIYYKSQEQDIYGLTIYDKSEITNISTDRLIAILKEEFGN